jgi:cytochrome b561
MIKNTAQRYGAVAMLLHWLIAALIIGMLALGLYMVRLPISLEKLRFYGWHKEFGLLVLALAIVRILWRSGNVTPSLLAAVPNYWQRLAAHAMHWVLYLFMFAMPLTGWLKSSAAGLPVSFFGWFVLPDLIVPNKTALWLLTKAHQWLAYALIAAICAHVGASLWHHFIHKDDVLRRMLP